MLNINLILRETLVHKRTNHPDDEGVQIVQYYQQDLNERVHLDYGYAYVCFADPYYVPSKADAKTIARKINDAMETEIKYFIKSTASKLIKPIIIVGWENISTVDKYDTRQTLPKSEVYLLYMDNGTETYMLADYQYISTKYKDSFDIDDKPTSDAMKAPFHLDGSSYTEFFNQLFDRMKKGEIK